MASGWAVGEGGSSIPQCHFLYDSIWSRHKSSMSNLTVKHMCFDSQLGNVDNIRQEQRLQDGSFSLSVTDIHLKTCFDPLWTSILDRFGTCFRLIFRPSTMVTGYFCVGFGLHF